MRLDVLKSVEDAVLVQGVGKDLRDRSCSGLVRIGEDTLIVISADDAVVSAIVRRAEPDEPSATQWKHLRGTFSSCMFPIASVH